MAGINGRGFLLQQGGTTVGGSTSGSVSLNNEIIDSTNKDGAGWKDHLSDGTLGGSISGSGMIVDDATFKGLRDDMLAKAPDTYTVVVPGAVGDSAGSYTGTGTITSLEETGDEGSVLSYSFTVEFKGVIVFTDLI